MDKDLHAGPTIAERYRSALITGASEGGLGRRIALHLARSGVAVTITARRQGSLDRVRAEIEDFGGSCLAAPANLSDPDQVSGVFDRAGDAFGPVDLLVNNAGIYLMKPFVEVSWDDWRATMDVILDGAFLCARRAVPAMIEQGAGLIINVSATSGYRPKPLLSVFNAAKYGLRGLSEALALELRPHGLHVVSLVLDGTIDHERNLSDSSQDERAEWLSVQSILRALDYLALEEFPSWTHELTLSSSEND